MREHCVTCKWFDLKDGMEPCLTCVQSTFDNGVPYSMWESEVEIVEV